MEWSEQTKEALQQWLGPHTWYKNHPIDDARFSLFIASVWNDGHRFWNEALAREKISQEAIRLHPGQDPLANEVAKERGAEGSTILNF